MGKYQKVFVFHTIIGIWLMNTDSSQIRSSRQDHLFSHLRHSFVRQEISSDRL